MVKKVRVNRQRCTKGGKTDIPSLLQSRDARPVEGGNYSESAREVKEVQQTVLKTVEEERIRRPIPYVESGDTRTHG